MKKSRTILTAVYIFLIALGVYNYFFENLNVKAQGVMLIMAGYIVNLAAINGKGGGAIRKLSLTFSGVISSAIIIVVIVLNFIMSTEVKLSSFQIVYFTLILGLLIWTMSFLRKTSLYVSCSSKLEELPEVLLKEAKLHLADGYKLHSYKDDLVTMVKNMSMTQKYYVYLKEENGQVEITTG